MNRFTSLSCITIATLSSGLMLTMGLNTPAYAGSRFFCGSYKGGPATFVRTKQGPVPMIRWTSNAFAPSRDDRCPIVSQRLVNFQQNGKLRYLRTGQVGKYPVICVANTRSGSCPSDQVVVTLQPGRSASTVYNQLKQIAQGANAKPVELSGSCGPEKLTCFDGVDPVSRQAVYYLDVDKWLDSLDSPISNKP